MNNFFVHMLMLDIWLAKMFSWMFCCGAGSGSIFETMRHGKPLIVVVNEDLMDNQQSELAEELAERKHLYYARPKTLCQTTGNMNLDSLIPYHPGDATPVAKLINRFLGFSDDWWKCKELLLESNVSMLYSFACNMDAWFNLGDKHMHIY